MLITIISDASHDPNTKACGWSWWLASSRVKGGGQGHEPEPVTNCTVAETIGIFRALLGACNKGMIHPRDEVLIQTDCQASISAIEGRRFNITEEEIKIVVAIWILAKELCLTLIMRHVKGHTAGLTPSTWINNQCDERAGIEMRKAKKLLRAAPVVDLSPPWD